MTRNFNELISGKLYVGSAQSASVAATEGLVSHIYDVRIKGYQQHEGSRYTHQAILEEEKAFTIKAGAVKIAQSLNAGEAVYIHCGSGTGRAAVMAAATLVELGEVETVAEAIATVKEKREGARFTDEMVEALRELYK